MEPGKNISEALRREVLEEAGLDVDIRRLIGVYSEPEFAVTYPNDDHTQYVVLFFECQVLNGIARPDDDEMLEWRYFSQDELPSLRPCCIAKANDAWAPSRGANHSLRGLVVARRYFTAVQFCIVLPV